MQPDLKQSPRLPLRRHAVAGVFAMLCAVPPARAAEFEIVWHVVGSGGTSAAENGSYSLAGTIAQPVAGMSAGGGYTLDAGFWQTLPVSSDQAIFTDGFED